MSYKSRSNYALSNKITEEEFDRIFKEDKETKTCEVCNCSERDTNSVCHCENCKG